MKIWIALILATTLLSLSCRKSEEQQPQELTLPATVNGTVDLIDFENINKELGLVDVTVAIKTSDGKKVDFKFYYSDTAYHYVGGGIYSKGKMNSTVWFDKDSLLLSTSIINTPIIAASTLYTGLASPNAIHIRFNEIATQDQTKGAKVVNATFTADSRLLVSFFATSNDDAMTAQYEADRALSVSKIDTLVTTFNHYKKDASLPPSPAWTTYSK